MIKKHINSILLNNIPNNFHIMLIENYKLLLPLKGSSGNCEADMCSRFRSFKFKHAELQDFIYIFHTHAWKKRLPIICQ